MAIKVIVEFQAKPGARAELSSLLEGISASLGPSIPGFLGSRLYEVLTAQTPWLRSPNGTRRTRRRPPWSTRWHRVCMHLSSNW
jgi:hypothetical protein